MQKACGKDAAMKAMPQRHRIAEFAAVVGTGRKGKAAQKAYGKGVAMKAMPQRHLITESAAVVETGRKTFIIFTNKNTNMMKRLLLLASALILTLTV